MGWFRFFILFSLFFIFLHSFEEAICNTDILELTLRYVACFQVTLETLIILSIL